jgi:hypothetical protein
MGAEVHTVTRYSNEHALAIASDLENEVFGASDSEGEQIEEAASVIRSLIADRDELNERVGRINEAAVGMNTALNTARTARPLRAWTVDDGDVLWITQEVASDAWCGTPLDAGWPGYHTHFLPLPDMKAVYFGTEA